MFDLKATQLSEIEDLVRRIVQSADAIEYWLFESDEPAKIWISRERSEARA